MWKKTSTLFFKGNFNSIISEYLLQVDIDNTIFMRQFGLKSCSLILQMINLIEPKMEFREYDSGPSIVLHRFSLEEVL